MLNENNLLRQMRPEVKEHHSVSKQKKKKIKLSVNNNLNMFVPIHKEWKQCNSESGLKISCGHFKTSVVWFREVISPSSKNILGLLFALKEIKNIDG